MTKIFVTGVTGYIGGDAVHAIATAHPEYEFTCLARKAAKVAKDHASFMFVYGDLDSADLLEEEAKKADIVLHFASAGRQSAIEPLLLGLRAHDPARPGFLIHTSGTGILMHADAKAERVGEPSDKVYNDLDGLAEVRAIPHDFAHRPVEEAVLATGSLDADRVKTAIVCPPCIYGQGRGSDNTRSMQIPELARVTLERGHGVTVGKGKNVWSGIHVHDLSALYLLLVENAAAGGSLAEWPGKPALWGEEGFFFCESETVKLDEVAKLVAREAKAQGYIQSDEVKAITAKEASELTHRGDALWGYNSRSQAKRAREALRWEATRGKKLEEVIKEQVEIEGRALEVRKPHVKVAAGEA